MNLKQSTITFVAVGLFIIIINILIIIPSQPQLCGFCHKAEYNTWQKSSHENINCNLCHHRPDLVSFFSQRFDVARMIFAYPLSLLKKKTISADVPNVVCSACHSNDEKTSINKGIRINHKAIIKSAYRCTGCHSTVVHGKAVPNPRFASMDKCTACHIGKSPSSECITCHVENVSQLDRTFKGPWQISHGKNWRKLHGMGDTSGCGTCHADYFCLVCHSVSMPHPDAWMNQHGKEALKSREGCLKCHKEAFCDSCHHIEMPHQSNFLEVHSKQAKKIGKKVCYRCHQEQGCLRCHSQHIHPGLPQEWLKKLREEIDSGR
ncbi:MAG: hypothetical protein AB1743_03900 [Actinomycetota bacterium]